MKPTISNSLFIELSCDISDNEVQRRMGHLANATDANGDEHYTEEGQDLFNEIYSEVQAIIKSHFKIEL